MAKATGRPRTDVVEVARFERIYADHYELILAYALRRTETPDDAVDIVAETFLTAWRRLDKAPDGPVVRLWLYGIARRVNANHRRGRHRHARLVARLRADAIMIRQANDRTTPEVGSSEVGSSVADAFRRLGPDDREILTLVAAEGLAPQAVAEVLGCSAVAARVRLHRARARFARELRATGVIV